MLIIGYDDDIGKARDIILKIISEDDRIHKDPAPVVEVNNLGNSSVDFTVRMWLTGADFFAVKWAMNRRVKEQFDAANVTIPYPTQTHIQKQG